MRVALWVDMEGTSHILDHRECWPAFLHYWKTGRPKLMSDVSAAAQGLLDGGAKEVIVVNAHGLGWPNILPDKLPKGCKTDEENENNDFDAIFQVGFHSRAGTKNGFISHTMVPNILSIELNSKPITESHVWGFLNALPIIGIVGDGALGAQLDGALKNTPFLGVKNSTSRSVTEPVYPTAEKSGAAIRTFAEQSIKKALPKPPTLPQLFKISIKLKPEISKDAVEIEVKNWAEDVQPMIENSMGLAMESFFEISDGLDLSSEKAMEKQDPEKLELLRKYLINFATE